MDKHPSVAIIILNWNGWRDTLNCVSSCQKLSWPNYSILVVDNGSTDDSEKYLRQNLPADVAIIQSGANLGFAGGNNHGIRRAIQGGAEYVWLLNNDTEVDPEALTCLVAAMENGPEVGIAGSKIYYFDNPRTIWFAGGMWRKGRLHWLQRGANQTDDGQFDQLTTVDAVSGCSMLVRSAAIHKIGLMDENFFLYWEDTEWCARAQKYDYQVVFVPQSRVWHKISVSTVQSSFSQYYYFTRNGFFFLRQYDLWMIPVFCLYNVLFGLKSLMTGNIQPLRGLAHGCTDFMRGRKGPVASSFNTHLQKK